jgi:hypothetical protein
MSIGPGKYDHHATVVRQAENADAVILLVLGGSHGSGFSVQAKGTLFELPDLLEDMAASIRADLAPQGNA